MTQEYRGFPVHDDYIISVPDGPSETSVLEKWRGNNELTPAEREVLEAWNRRNCLDNAIAFLDGVHPEDYFGEGSTLDQVHGQSWHPDVCDGNDAGQGCVIHQVWDHRLRGGKEPIVHHVHRQHRVCSRHAHLTDKHDHHETVVRECRHKEDVLSKITDSFGLKNHERPAWRFRPDHTLEIDATSHPILTPRHIRELARAHFPNHTIHAV